MPLPFLPRPALLEPLRYVGDHFYAPKGSKDAGTCALVIETWMAHLIKVCSCGRVRVHGCVHAHAHGPPRPTPEAMDAEGRVHVCVHVCVFMCMPFIKARTEAVNAEGRVVDAEDLTKPARLVARCASRAHTSECGGGVQ